MSSYSAYPYQTDPYHQYPVYEHVLTDLDAPTPSTSSAPLAVTSSKKRRGPELEVLSEPAAKRRPAHEMQIQNPHGGYQVQELQQPMMMYMSEEEWRQQQALYNTANYGYYEAHQTQQPLQQQLQQHYYQQRPEPSTTPPMSVDHKYHMMSVQQQTPTEIVQPPNSIMYTPESDVSTVSSNQTFSTNVTSEDIENMSPSAGYNFSLSRTQHVDKDNCPSIARNTTTQQQKDDYEIHKTSEMHNIYPTFGVPVARDGMTAVQEIDGRLPAVGNRSKYVLTVDELRRRTGAPEFMNQSALYCFFRKSKKKEAITDVKRVLTTFNIPVKTMQRQKKLTCFSPMLEEEAVQITKDLDKLYVRYMPYLEIARQMLENLFIRGHHLDGCLHMLNKTSQTIDRIIKTMKTRQPKVTGKVEQLKGTFLDVSYHSFSLMTHGYGHPNSLSHYNHFLKIVKTAISLCEQYRQGVPIDPIDVVIPGAKPFQYMSNEWFVTWQQNELQRKIDEEAGIPPHDYQQEYQQQYQLLKQQQQQLPLLENQQMMQMLPLPASHGYTIRASRNP